MTQKTSFLAKWAVGFWVLTKWFYLYCYERHLEYNSVQVAIIS